MAAHDNLFTEEGRTRLRNFWKRVLSYAGVSSLAAIGAAILSCYLYLNYGLGHLQYMYLKSFAVSSVKGALSAKKSSTYRILVRVVTDPVSKKDVIIGCNDDQVEPVPDETGNVLNDPHHGPVFKLNRGVEAKAFYWNRSALSDRAMASWFKEHIYQGKSFLGLFLPSLLIAAGIFIVGFGGMVFTDYRANKSYEGGKKIRGTKELTPEVFAREFKDATGIGIPVSQPKVRA